MTEPVEASCPGAPAPSDRQPTVASQAVSAAPGQRLVSLDALRGFTMFWIVGGREFLLAIVMLAHPAWFDPIETQLMHPKWQGCRLWDLVMPLFLFVVGAAMPLAMAKRRQRGQSLAGTYRRIIVRVAVLWMFGMIAQWIKYKPEGLELYSNALQAIAVGYLATSIALLHLSVRGQIVLFALLTAGYGALLMYVPFNGHPGGTLEPRLNIAHYVDMVLLGRFRCNHKFTWILTSLGFSASVLLGALAGHLFCKPLSPRRRLVWLGAVGAVLAAAGWLWSCWLPLNRHLWTSSLVLWAGGWSFLLLAAFYAVIDLSGVKRWAFPFVVIGANALTAYMLDPAFERLGNLAVYGMAFRAHLGEVNLLSSTIEIASLWLVLWVLYRRRLFLRA